MESKKMVEEMKCKPHSKKAIIYCDNDSCKEMLCKDCLNKDEAHDDHKIYGLGALKEMPINSKIEKKKMDLTVMAENLKKCESELNTQKGYCDKYQEEIEKIHATEIGKHIFLQMGKNKDELLNVCKEIMRILLEYMNKEQDLITSIEKVDKELDLNRLIEKNKTIKEEELEKNIAEIFDGVMVESKDLLVRAERDKLDEQLNFFKTKLGQLEVVPIAGKRKSQEEEVKVLSDNMIPAPEEKKERPLKSKRKSKAKGKEKKKPVPSAEKEKEKEISLSADEENNKKKEVEEEEEEKVAPVPEKATTKKLKKKSEVNKEEGEIKLPENTFFVSAQNLLNKLLEHAHSEPFEKPLDPNDNPEAYNKISEHMDLNTMKKKLEEFKYQDKESFAKDLQLIFNNGKSYYKKNTKNWKYANELEKFSKPILAKIESPSTTELEGYKAILGDEKEKDSENNKSGSNGNNI